MKKIKKDNSGFTLVELLIAIVIIAIVLTPLYSNFRQSTYLNGKAKKAMDATNMASNLMEGLSAYTPEEIILGFYSNDSVDVSIPDRYNTLNIMPNEVTVTEYGDLVPTSGGYAKGFITSDLVLGAGSYDYSSANYAQSRGTTASQPSMNQLKIKESPDGKYYFYAAGVDQARGVYDIVVELDTTHVTGFSGDFNGDGIIDSSPTGGEVYGINDFESAFITNINPLFDGVYSENISQRQNAAAALLAKKTNPSVNLDAADLYPGMVRTINVVIERDVSTGFVSVTVKENYAINSDFVTPDGRTINLGNVFTGQTLIYSTTDKLVFDGSTYQQDPRSIYLYYNANYYSTNTRYLDKFVIDNPDHVPVDLYLLRTKSAETTDPLEESYASELRVNDVTGTGDVKIYSNLRDHILKTDAQNASSTYRGNFNRCLTNIGNRTVHGFPDAEYERVVHDTGGVKKETENRMYSVKMYVYDAGAAAAGFPAEMLVTEFGGSSLQ